MDDTSSVRAGQLWRFKTERCDYIVMTVKKAVMSPTSVVSSLLYSESWKTVVMWVSEGGSALGDLEVGRRRTNYWPSDHWTLLQGDVDD